MTHGQRVALRVQVRTATKVTRLLLGVERLAQSVDRLVEVRRREVRGKRIQRALRERLTLAGFNETAQITRHVSRLAQVLFKGHTSKGETRALVRAQHGALLGELISTDHIGVAGERIEEEVCKSLLDRDGVCGLGRQGSSI